LEIELALGLELDFYLKIETKLVRLHFELQERVRGLNFKIVTLRLEFELHLKLEVEFELELELDRN